VATNPDASYSQIAEHISMSKSSSKNYTKELMKSGRLHKNGNGWEVRQ
jgi:hypothetical protein